jgi:Mn2+/Fe2+ NRAMP family transporter
MQRPELTRWQALKNKGRFFLAYALCVMICWAVLYTLFGLNPKRALVAALMLGFLAMPLLAWFEKRPE